MKWTGKIIRGEVVHGVGRGRGLGFPTLNIAVGRSAEMSKSGGVVDLAHGVYIVRVDMGGDEVGLLKEAKKIEDARLRDVREEDAPSDGIEQKKYSGVMNWGGRPTFNEDTPVLEVHLLDLQEVGRQGFYGAMVDLEVGPLLRGVQRFESAEALKIQIAEDVRRARTFFQTGVL